MIKNIVRYASGKHYVVMDVLTTDMNLDTLHSTKIQHIITRDYMELLLNKTGAGRFLCDGVAIVMS